MSTIADHTPFYKRLAFVLLSLSLILLILYVGQDILMPLLFAVLLSVLLLPVYNFLERRKFNRVLAILITLAISMIVIFAIIYFLSQQVFSFLDDFDNIQERLNTLYYTLQHWVKKEFGLTITKQNQYIQESRAKMDAGSIVASTVVSLTTLISYLILLPIYTFLILYYKGLIKKFLIAVFKNSDANRVTEILNESRSISQQYIIGLMIELVVVFGMNAAGFLILGIKYALFLALVAALLNLVPYIGMLIANAFCMIITLVSTENFTSVLWVGLILAVVQFIDNNFLMTLIVGSKVKINSLATVVGVLVGGAICGVPGMFLSIPALAVLKVICDHVEGLHPYGLLLGDEKSPSTAKQRTASKVNAP